MRLGDEVATSWEHMAGNHQIRLVLPTTAKAMLLQCHDRKTTCKFSFHSVETKLRWLVSFRFTYSEPWPGCTRTRKQDAGACLELRGHHSARRFRDLARATSLYRCGNTKKYVLTAQRIVNKVDAEWSKPLVRGMFNQKFIGHNTVASPCVARLSLGSDTRSSISSSTRCTKRTTGVSQRPHVRALRST